MPVGDARPQDLLIKTIFTLRTTRTMISAVQQQNAIQQNNTATSLIAAGEYNTAIQELSFALQVYKQVITEPDNEITQPVKTSLDQCMVQSLVASDCPKACHHANDNKEDQHYMYRQAIRIPLKDIESTYQASAMVSSMIIFNSALAHHLSALASSMHQWKKFHQAATLYQLADTLQRDAQLENNVLFTMAAVNNLGMIYHQLKNNERSAKCFRQLLSTVMLLVDCGEAEVCCGELDGFLRNVTNLDSESSCAAAAE
jgi:tetratricopeptide (TPR) repeat protein